jgi:hypothetical protein
LSHPLPDPRRHSHASFTLDSQDTLALAGRTLGAAPAGGKKTGCQIGFPVSQADRKLIIPGFAVLGLDLLKSAPSITSGIQNYPWGGDTMPMQVNPGKLRREMNTLADQQTVERTLVVKNLTVRQWKTLLSNPDPLPTISDAVRYALDELADFREEAKDRRFAQPAHQVMEEDEVARLAKAISVHLAGKLGQAIADALVEPLREVIEVGATVARKQQA